MDGWMDGWVGMNRLFDCWLAGLMAGWMDVRTDR